MVEQTLEYENAHFLLSLLAGDVDLAQAIGKEFDIRVTTRDTWIKFFGDKENVRRAIMVMKDLESARRDGAPREHLNVRRAAPASKISLKKFMLRDINVNMFILLLTIHCHWRLMFINRV